MVPPFLGIANRGLIEDGVDKRNVALSMTDRGRDYEVWGIQYCCHFVLTRIHPFSLSISPIFFGPCTHDYTEPP